MQQIVATMKNDFKFYEKRKFSDNVEIDAVCKRTIAKHKTYFEPPIVFHCLFQMQMTATFSLLLSHIVMLKWFFFLSKLDFEHNMIKHLYQICWRIGILRAVVAWKQESYYANSSNEKTEHLELRVEAFYMKII